MQPLKTTRFHHAPEALSGSIIHLLPVKTAQVALQLCDVELLHLCVVRLAVAVSKEGVHRNAPNPSNVLHITERERRQPGWVHVAQCNCRKVNLVSSLLM